MEERKTTAPGPEEPSPDGLTVEEYYAAVDRLQLKPTAVPHTYWGPEGMSYNVPDGTRYTPQQRARLIERLTLMIKGF